MLNKGNSNNNNENVYNRLYNRRNQSAIKGLIENNELNVIEIKKKDFKKRDEEEKNKIKEQNEKNKENNTLQNIFNNFKSNKGKSRNRNNNNNEKKNGFTFIPKKENQIINTKEKK